MENKVFKNSSYPDLFKRNNNNPIITAKDLPYPAHTIFNPASVIFNGNTLLLSRVEDRRGYSHLAKSISKDGLTDWVFDPAPTVRGEPDIFPEERWGMEDPRITWMEDLKRYAVVYTAFSKAGPLISLALTDDFVNFEKQGLIMSPDDKDGALFPRKFNGKYLLIHRPSAAGSKSHMWISSSSDLKSWGEHQILLKARSGGSWDANKIGLSAQPLETKDGWLILYHSVRNTAAGAIYRLGLALLDLNDPTIVIKRSDEWIFGPEEPYEKFGDVSDVVFPCGWIHNEETGEVTMYYGGADSCVCSATAKMSDLLAYISSCPNPREDD